MKQPTDNSLNEYTKSGQALSTGPPFLPETPVSYTDSLKMILFLHVLYFSENDNSFILSRSSCYSLIRRTRG